MLGFFLVLHSKFKLENIDIITLQTCVASCWLNIGIVCQFFYTTSFRTHAIKIKLLV